MALSHRTLTLRAARGLVVRPRPGGGPDQALVFLSDGGVHELMGTEDGAAGATARLGPSLTTLAAPPLLTSLAYDPASDAVYFAVPCRSAAGGLGGLAFQRSMFSKLDASNRISDMAGWEGGLYSNSISALAPAVGSRGILWVAERKSIRRLDTHSGEVTTLEGVEPLHTWWQNLAWDPAAGTLLAATSTALCRVRTEGAVEGRVELVAGRWDIDEAVDGSGEVARFKDITGMLPVPGGRLLIADGLDLRCMDAGGAVTTLLRGCFPSGEYRQMAILPSGELGVMMQNGRLVLVSGGDWASPVPPPPAATTDLLLSLLAPQAAAEDAGGSGSGDASVAPGTVTVRVGGRAFPAHRSVLAAGSEYFARLLAPGGGFAESGAAELLTPPPELLRPTAALAGRLLMGGGAVAALTERLAAAATPASVLSDLAWADAHGMTDLAGQLRAYAARKRKAVELDGLEQLAEQSPKQAAKLMKALADL
ncbi:hypothetical protein HYH03_008459 [Edaphochlamys debaryana]|uniref:BTB domain-containing protein n=1 Tax=Edaphochlamys debaryana TaxID=47281 RepID=A0A835Y964_9CHLO|nr:hypothetical protein HYH03_008459 [Edaphochlamys debaryana]|eukprot:KAG2493324.1 hypothetical protein HYH03_008459 [Edaphochlamys debaryana]